MNQKYNIMNQKSNCQTPEYPCDTPRRDTQVTVALRDLMDTIATVRTQGREIFDRLDSVLLPPHLTTSGCCDNPCDKDSEIQVGLANTIRGAIGELCEISETQLHILKRIEL